MVVDRGLAGRVIREGSESSELPGRPVRRESYTRSSGMLLNQFWVLLSSVILQLGYVNSCPIEGCIPEKCSIVAEIATCSLCNQGYFKQNNQAGCSLCASQCASCTAWTICQSCQPGYFIESGSSGICLACSANCDSCSSRTFCSKCSTGFISSVDNSACESSSSNQQSGDKGLGATSIGPIIGYVVSGLVLVICCTITIIHQRKKQQEAEKGKTELKEVKPGQVTRLNDGSQPAESTTKIKASISGSNIVVPKALKSHQTFTDLKGDELAGSEQRGLVRDPQPEIAPSPQLMFSPARFGQRSKVQRPTGAEHIGLLNSPQRSSLKLYSPMIGTASSTPGSLLTGGASSRIQSMRETPLSNPKPSPQTGTVRGLVSPGFSSNSLKFGNSPTPKLKIINQPGLASPMRNAGGFTLNLFRIKRIEQ